jgi:Fe-S-cluster-containing dehydrogenase component
MEQYRDRWSSFGSHSGILAVSDKPSAAELREFEIFQDFDDSFLEAISPDVSIVLWRGDVVLFEQGTYLDLAFFVADGEVEVYLEGVGDPIGTPIFDTSRTMMTRGGLPSSGAVPSPEESVPESPFAGRVMSSGDTLKPTSSTGTTRMDAARTASRSHEITFLATMDFDLPRGTGACLGAGELFGEIGAMSGWPQSVTARTVQDCRLVQIRIPALRMMKKRSKALKERVDQLYRKRALHNQLQSTPIFRGLNDFYIEALKEVVELISCDPGEVVVREGEVADAIYLVRSGFVKLSQRFGEGEMAISYLSKGMTLGEVEVLVEGLERWEVTATSVEYGELVKIPIEVFWNTVRALPGMEEKLWESATLRIREMGYSRRNPTQSEFIQVALDTGLVQGNSILVIDLESCTRCDDCVRACAATHDDRPRFVREGTKLDQMLIARSCYHCRDPVCLVGCPTGAIHRTGVGAVVDVTDEICIGCGTCANNCPYDAIVMHDTGGTWPEDMLPTRLRGEERRVASKCDLCEDTGHGPACVSNCPQGCAFRVSSLDELQKLIDRDD